MKVNERELIIPFENKKLIAKPKSIIIDKIFFDEDNPRISMSKDSHVIGTGKKTLGQELTGFFIRTQSSYSNLKNSIRASRGATVPIWVYPINEDNYKVIEGNTRLKIHKDLLEEDEDNSYRKINCMVLPGSLDEEAKDYLRLICHLRGQTEWDKYEQAKYLHTLYHQDKYPVKSLVKITKLSQSEILQDIEAYEIMSGQFRDKYGDNELVNRYSYFKEFVKNKKLRQTMFNLNLSESDFCDWVGLKKIDKAMDVRKLNSVLKEPESRKMFIKKDLDRALETLRFIVPEKTEKVYILISELVARIENIRLIEINEIRDPKSKKHKILSELYNRIGELIGVK